jgi:hypothetical protein
MQIMNSIRSFFHNGQLRGSLGLLEGWGTSTMSEFLPLACFSTDVSNLPWWWRRSEPMTSLSRAVPGTCSRCVSSKTPRPIVILILETFVTIRTVDIWQKKREGKRAGGRVCFMNGIFSMSDACNCRSVSGDIVRGTSDRSPSPTQTCNSGLRGSGPCTWPSCYYWYAGYFLVILLFGTARFSAYLG